MAEPRVCNRTTENDFTLKETDQSNWYRLLHRLDLEDPGAKTYRKLCAAYSGTGRHYHSLGHIEDCLSVAHS